MKIPQSQVDQFCRRLEADLSDECQFNCTISPVECAAQDLKGEGGMLLSGGIMLFLETQVGTLAILRVEGSPALLESVGAQIQATPSKSNCSRSFTQIEMRLLGKLLGVFVDTANEYWRDALAFGFRYFPMIPVSGEPLQIEQDKCAAWRVALRIMKDKRSLGQWDLTILFLRNDWFSGM